MPAAGFFGIQHLECGELRFLSSRVRDHDKIVIMIAPIQIRNPEVVRDIRLLAELMRQPITDVVAEAVRAKLAEAQLAKEADIERRSKEIKEIHKRVAALPRIGRLLTDADLYDADGLPK